MKSTLIKPLVVASVLFFLAMPHALSQSVPKLINYQGKLTDSSGNPLPNGTYGVAFRVWSKKAVTEAGDQLIWGQEYNVAVANGVFNVILGAPGGTRIAGAAVNDLGYAFVESSRFIGLTVTRGANGTPIPGASEITPRQQILASPYALNSANGCPVGGVIMWWGNLAGIPENFELSDGLVPTTPGATLAGPKPDLRDRFPKGATSGAFDAKGTPTYGGTNRVAQRLSGGTTLSTAQMPSHSHTVTDPGHTHTLDGAGIGNQGAAGSIEGAITPRTITSSRAVTGISLASAGNGQPHDHAIPEHDNRPAFLELFFIIRVK